MDIPHSFGVNMYLSDKFSKDIYPYWPKNLYHYTSAVGLTGIIQSGQLWATHIKFLNDYSEFVYGVDICRNVYEKYLQKTDNEDIRCALESVMRYIEGIHLLEGYVCCFCEEADLLSQWRGYGNKGAGYSIEFDYKNLVRNLTQTAIMQRMIYDKNLQFKIIREIFDIVRDSMILSIKKGGGHAHTCAFR
ncbi:hypothetical protein JCM17960_26600 [Magnetospira thiophila]